MSEVNKVAGKKPSHADILSGILHITESRSYRLCKGLGVVLLINLTRRKFEKGFQIEKSG